MGAISGLYAMSALYDLVQDKRRGKRLEEAMRRHGIEESAVKDAVFALGYFADSPEDRDKVWKSKIVTKKYGIKTAEIRAKKEDAYGHLAATVLRHPEFRHAWINNPKREAELAKLLESEPSGGESRPQVGDNAENETEHEKLRKRMAEALRARYHDEDTINSELAALDYVGLSHEERDKMFWKGEWSDKTSEERKEYETAVHNLVRRVMRDPDLRHLWMNDPEREAEVAKWVERESSSMDAETQYWERRKRMEEALRAKGYSEENIKDKISALAYESASPEQKDMQWKKQFGTKRPDVRVQREAEVSVVLQGLMHDPDLRHAWVHDPKREAELAKMLESEQSRADNKPREGNTGYGETRDSNRRKRMEEACRAVGLEEEDIPGFLDACDFHALSAEDQEKVRKAQNLTHEERVRREHAVKMVWTNAMRHPALRHAWINDAQIEAEMAKRFPPVANNG